MTQPQSKLKPLLGSLGCLAVAATSTLMSGTLSGGVLSIAGNLLNGIMGDLSINIASDQLLKLSPQILRKSMLPKSKDTSNHDLQKSLQNALITALVNCYEIYAKASGGQKDKSHLKALERKIKSVCDSIRENFLENVGENVNDQEIIDFEEGLNFRINELMTEFLYDIEDFEQHGRVFMPLLKEQLPLQINYAFTQELKDNSKCWIAYQRALLQDLRANSKQIVQDVETSNEKLDKVIKQLDGLHQAGQKIDEDLLKTLIATNVDVNNLMESSKDLMEGFISEQRRRIDQLEKKIIQELHALMDISLSNQELLQKIHDCILPDDKQDTPTNETESALDYDKLIKVVLPKYLRFISEEYRLISLPNIKGDASKQTIPLDNIYIALHMANDRTSKDFRVASQFIKKQITNAELNAKRELSAYEKRKLEATVLEQNQSLKNFDYKDLKGSSKQSISLAELFGKERYSVLLGDPGSGKSTIVKWLALQLANQFDAQNKDQRVVVNSNKIYGVDSESEDQNIDLGPVRLPIVIKIPEYTQFYERQKNTTENGIIDFCGIHLPTIPGLTPQDFRQLISHYLASNQAVVFLDGMDEVVKDPDKILLEIRKFIRHWINLGESEINLLSPNVAGGNQIVITSRIVGYHAAPLDDYIKEVYVRAMDDIAIKSFCRLWTRETSKSLDNEAINQDSEGLIKAIFDENKPRIKELATNPLLITILALLYHSQGKKLPHNRTELYEETVNILMGKWSSLHQDIHPENVKILIEEVATVIHASPSEVIMESDLKELLTNKLNQLNTKSDLSKSSHLAEAFIRIIRQDVGLLSERGHDLYHFLHRTFQEFLSARKIIRNADTAVNEILNKMNDPVWREPVTMAIAFANASWSANRFGEFIDSLLNTQEGYAGLIPLAPMLVSSTIPDMQKVDKPLVKKLLLRLLGALESKEGLAGFDNVSQRIKKSIDQLRENEQASLFLSCTSEIFKQQEYGHKQWLLLNLACDGEWEQHSWLEDIYQHLDEDPQAYNFPIDRYLRMLFSTNKDYDDLALLKFKSRLTKKPQLVKRIEAEPKMLRLISVLYGGWPSHSKMTLYDDLEEVSIAYHSKSVEMEEKGYSYAVRLDTELGKIKEIKTLPITFNIQHIHRDSYFTRPIMFCLQSEESASSLIPSFVDAFKEGDSIEEKAQALLALAALNENVIDLVAEETKKNLEAYDRFNAHMQRIMGVLHLPLREFIRRSDKGRYLKEQSWDNLELQDSRAMLHGIMELCQKKNYKPPLLIPGDRGKYIYEGELNRENGDPLPFAQQFADSLIAFTMPSIGDAKYKITVALDTMGNFLLRDKASHLLEAILSIPYSPLLDSSLNTSWSIPQIIVPAKNKKYALINYLNIVLGLSSDFNTLKEYLIHAIWQQLSEHPGLQELALCLFIERQGSLSKKWIESILGQGHPEELIFKSVTQNKDPLIQFLMAYFVERSLQTVQMPIIMSTCLPKITEEDDLLIATSCSVQIDLSSKLYYINSMIQDQMNSLNVPMNSPTTELDYIEPLIAQLSKSESPTTTCIALWLAIESGIPSDRNKQIDLFTKAIPWIASDKIKAYLIKKYNNLHFLTQKNSSYLTEWRNSFEDKFYFHTVTNEIHKSLNAIADRYPDNGILNILSLSQMAEEYVMEHTSMSEVELSLTKLSQDGLNDDDFKNLLFHGRNGIRLTKKIIEYIDLLNKTGDQDKLAALLPLLELHMEKDIHLIEHWQHTENVQLGKFYYLLLGENRILNIKVLEAMCDILKQDSDRLSRRAQIVLHGPNPVFGFNEPAFRASELGYSYLLHHYQKVNKCQFEEPFTKNVLEWSHENWVDDDPQIIQRAVDEHGKAKGQTKKALSSMISNMNRLTTETLTEICQLIKTTEPGTGKYLWLALSHAIHRLKNNQVVLSFTDSDLLEILKSENARLSLIEAEQLCLKKSQLVDLTKALIEHEVSSENLSTQCDQIKQSTLRNVKLNLSDYFEDTTTLMSQLVKFSKLGYYFRDTYESGAKYFLKECGDDVKKLSLLIKLLSINLEEDLFDNEFSYFGGNACYLLAAWASDRPEFVSHHFPEGNRIKRLLAEVICQHPGYIARSSAVNLVGALNLMTKEVLQSLINAITDIDIVSTQAIKVLVKYSDNLDEENLSVLKDILSSNNAEASASVIRMFANISMNPATNSEMRLRTLDILANQLKDLKSKPSKNKFVYSYNGVKSYNKGIPFAQWKESLDEVIFSQLIRFSET